MLNRQLTGDVALRLPELRDATALYGLIDRERGRLAEWLPWPATQTLTTIQEYIRLMRRQYADETGLTLLIVRGDAPIGVVGFNAINWRDGSAVVGYWLSATAEGEGIMTRAVRALVDHGFGRLGLHRIEIRAGVGNHRSRGVAERLGFRLEGEARDAERVGDRWVTHAVYARLAEDRD